VSELCWGRNFMFGFCLFLQQVLGTSVLLDTH